MIEHDVERRAWNAMKQRCFNPKCREYRHYGGRGITVCKRWKDSFLTFLADVGKRPNSQMSLNRIDNNGNYEPSNVQWATAAQQAANRRRTKPFFGSPLRRTFMLSVDPLELIRIKLLAIEQETTVSGLLLNAARIAYPDDPKGLERSISSLTALHATHEATQ